LSRYAAAKYGFVMISDAGIFMKKHTLSDMVYRLLDPKVGLVHQMPFMCDRPGFSSVVEKVCD
jgi:ceramide glucosyltransferase